MLGAEKRRVQSNPTLCVRWLHLSRSRHYCGFCCRVELPGNLVSCVECGNSGHQNCLEFNDRLWANVKRDPTWTCIECKACSVCKSTDEEEKMLFCEACDRVR